MMNTIKRTLLSRLHAPMLLSTLLITVIGTTKGMAQQLPGNGLKQHDFFYAGEAKTRNMYIVRDGQITWSYIDTVGKGEISDAILMKNGDVLFAHQFGVTLINRNKKVLWKYDAPSGFETHTAQLIGKERVMIVQNGTPAKVLVINIKTNQIETEFELPFKSTTHGQIRHARLTAEGTLLVAHMDLGKIMEYDSKGNVLLTIDAPGVWSAVPLKNGIFLVTSNRSVREITRKGDVVREIKVEDVADYHVTSPQLSVKLANGNIIINNWFNQWATPNPPETMPIQAIEISPDQKVVWALRAWSSPVNLGPSTIIQMLDGSDTSVQPTHFGEYK